MKKRDKKRSLKTARVVNIDNEYPGTGLFEEVPLALTDG